VADVALGMTPRAPVAIIGGGWAGCAAAATLAGAGICVELFEAAPVLGGRARRVQRVGLPLDNGQHLLLGAYEQTLALLDNVHGEAGARDALTRGPLAIMPLSATQPDALTLVRGRAEGTLGLLTGLLSARGLSWRERIANIAWMRKLKRSGFVRPPYETVAQMLAPLPRRVAQGLWEPLCVAALNTPAATASAQIFANVLKAAFAGRANASDFLLPATDLSAVFPEAAARFVTGRGGAIRMSAPARVVRAARNATTVLTGTSLHEASAAIVAVGPHQIAGAFAPEAVAALPDIGALQATLATLDHEPIFTVWLGYGEALPLPMPIARLDDAPGQWVVDRPDVLAAAQADAGRPELRQLLAVILSAHGPHETLDHGMLALEIDAQLRRLQPDRPPCRWFQVIAEKRATYACTPGRARPAQTRLAEGIYLAGDYMNAEYPATLEAAMRSGVAAAEAVLADLRTTGEP
jgi:squalene-associated FAD-dependent desaturase